MREIKFRAWDKKNGMWLNRFNVNLLDIEDLSIVEINQYTGLKDFAEGEIYEGDVLDTGLNIAQVYFADGSFLVKFLDDSFDNLNEINDYCEVIGNIYENPELTEVIE